MLEIIDLRYNEIKTIEGLAFKGLRKIREIKLAGNRINTLNSDVFENLPTLQKLDLSENFIQKFPSVSLSQIENLKFLNLSSNMLQVRWRFFILNASKIILFSFSFPLAFGLYPHGSG